MTCILVVVWPHVNQFGGQLTDLTETIDLAVRLKGERKRLGMNQTDLAAFGGVGKDTQLNYENGSRTPDAKYLAGVAAIGVDVLYVVTGQRAEPLDSSSLDERQRELIANFEAADESGKSVIEATASLAAMPKSKGAARGRE